jgi:hypothetical protein
MRIVHEPNLDAAAISDRANHLSRPWDYNK